VRRLRGGATRAACGDLTDIQETSVLKGNHREAGVGILGPRTVAAAHPRVASSRRLRWTEARLAPAQAAIARRANVADSIRRTSSQCRAALDRTASTHRLFLRLPYGNMAHSLAITINKGVTARDRGASSSSRAGSVCLNTRNLVGAMRGWDPYPFILLNLALSFQAAYAVPVIMMSQNRPQEIDRKGRGERLPHQREGGARDRVAAREDRPTARAASPEAHRGRQGSDRAAAAVGVGARESDAGGGRPS
jgi:hypothetical protein